METSKAAYLTSVDSEGYPHTRAMFNLRNKEMWPRLIPMFSKHQEDFMIIFTTNTSSTKVPHLKANPKVSVYYCTPDSWKGFMVNGNIEIVNDSVFKQKIWHDGWERYYPKGYDDPDHTVLQLYPKLAKGWTGSQTFIFSISRYDSFA
jgi:general stress protein 26